MPAKWSDEPLRPEVASGLEPVWENVLRDPLVADIIKYPLRDINGNGLLPHPYTLVWLPPFILVCMVDRGQLMSIRPVPTEEFVSATFLGQLRQIIPQNTELAWTAEAGDAALRQALLQAMQLRKLARINVSSDMVYWSWHYYQLHFGVRGYGGPAPTLSV